MLVRDILVTTTLLGALDGTINLKKKNYYKVHVLKFTGPGKARFLFLHCILIIVLCSKYEKL